MMRNTDERINEDDPIETTTSDIKETESAEDLPEDTEHAEAEQIDPEEAKNFTPFNNPFGGFARLFEALGNKQSFEDKESPNYKALFETYGQIFEQQDKNMQYFNDAINNLVSQLNKYKRNQSWKLRITWIALVITWIVMFIKF